MLSKICLLFGKVSKVDESVFLREKFNVGRVHVSMELGPLLDMKVKV